MTKVITHSYPYNILSSISDAFGFYCFLYSSSSLLSLLYAAIREDRVLTEDVGLFVLVAVLLLLLLLPSSFLVVLLPVVLAFLVVCVSALSSSFFFSSSLSTSSAFRFFLTITNPSNAFLELPAEDLRCVGFLAAGVVTVAGNSGADVRVCSTALVAC